MPVWQITDESRTHFPQSLHANVAHPQYNMVTPLTPTPSLPFCCHTDWWFSVTLAQVTSLTLLIQRYTGLNITVMMNKMAPDRVVWGQWQSGEHLKGLLNHNSSDMDSPQQTDCRSTKIVNFSEYVPFKGNSILLILMNSIYIVWRCFTDSVKEGSNVSYKEC